MSTRYLILGGSGRQGRAIIHGLRRLDPDAYIEIVDKQIPIEETVRSSVDYIAQTDEPLARFKGSDVIVSALPYAVNEEVGKAAIQAGIRWVDLGGHVQTTDRLAAYAEQKGTAPVFLDQGLAPGLANILTWIRIRKYCSEPAGVEIRCGGLPVKAPENSFKYLSTFSIDGLINEYLNTCLELQGSRIVEVPRLRPEPVTWLSTCLEAFTTSGGAPESFLRELRSAGVSNCSYQTLRYPGHADAVLRATFAADFRKMFKNAVTPRRWFEDKVLLSVKMKRPDGVTSDQAYWEVAAAPDDGLTAMTRATGYSVAAVSYLAATGSFDSLKVVGFKDLDTPAFEECLETLDFLRQVV